MMYYYIMFKYFGSFIFNEKEKPTIYTSVNSIDEIANESDIDLNNINFDENEEEQLYQSKSFSPINELINETNDFYNIENIQNIQNIESEVELLEEKFNCEYIINSSNISIDVNLSIYYDKRCIILTRRDSLDNISTYLQIIKFDDIVGITYSDDIYVIITLPIIDNERVYEKIYIKLDNKPKFFEDIINKKKSLHLFINQNSGYGNALTEAKYVIVPCLLDCNFDITFNLVDDDIYDDIDNSNYDNVDEFGILGGDGTVSSITNYLMIKNKIKPINIYPFGTHNSIYKSLNKKYNSIYESIYAQVKNNNIKELNLIEVDGINNKKYYINSLLWGFPSEIDNSTYYLKFLGKYRYNIGQFINSFIMNYYNGSISYLPLEDVFKEKHVNRELNKINTDINNINEPWITIETFNNNKFIGIWVSKMDNTNDGLKINEYHNIENDNYFRIVMIRSGISFLELNEILHNFKCGYNVSHPNVIIIYTKAFILKSHYNDNHILIDGEESNSSVLINKISENKIEIKI